MAAETPTVLVVEDEPDLAEVYVAHLDDEYEVLEAHDGEGALAAVERESVDAALLDRRLPRFTGREVLERIRERAGSCRVAMVTARTPDVDVVDMPFDAYLVKPVTRSDLHETVQQLLRLGTYDETAQERFSLAEKRAVLEAARSREELAGDERYRELCNRLADTTERAESAADGLDHETFRAALSDL